MPGSLTLNKWESTVSGFELRKVIKFFRKFQEINIGLKNITVTGECDDSTVMVMNMPRCGCEDIVKMEKKMMPQNLYGPLEYIVGKYSKTYHKRPLQKTHQNLVFNINYRLMQIKKYCRMLQAFFKNTVKYSNSGKHFTIFVNLNKVSLSKQLHLC